MTPARTGTTTHITVADRKHLGDTGNGCANPNSIRARFSRGPSLCLQINDRSLVECRIPDR